MHMHACGQSRHLARDSRWRHVLGAELDELTEFRVKSLGVGEKGEVGTMAGVPPQARGHVPHLPCVCKRKVGCAAHGTQHWGHRRSAGWGGRVAFVPTCS
eukprot:363783-Chlamydomonas_euryale.AAC.6